MATETSIAERIAERLEELTAGERRAANALIGDYPMAGLATVADYARRAGVSGPTILRFVARLGFQNYPEFQAAVKDEVAARLQSPVSRVAIRAGEDRGAFPALDATIQNIEESVRHVPAGQLGQIVRLMTMPRNRVFLVGGRFTDPLARYMAAHLTLVRPNVFHLAGQESMWRDRLVDLTRRDVLLIFDIRRYQDSLLAFAGAAHARGAQIVLFTDQWLSPIARFSAHVLAGRTAVPSAWDSSASLFVLSEMLVGAVTTALGEAGDGRIRAIEEVRGLQTGDGALHHITKV